MYAKKLGVDIDDLILSQPDSGDQALQITELLIKSGAIDLIVVDSVAALVPQAELDGTIGDSSIGLQARLMSQAMRKLAGAMNRSKCTVIFINQLREKIGIMFGNPETTPGGRALKFYSSIRLEVRKGEPIKQGSDIIGNKTNIKIVKNKVAPPFKTAQIEIRYGEGISHTSEIIDLGVEFDLIEKSGTWFSYKGDKIGQGFQAVREFMRSNPAIDAEITEQVKAKLFPEPQPEAAEAKAE
jgi:recombination protein RecA